MTLSDRADAVTPADIARRIDERVLHEQVGKGPAFVDEASFLRRLTLDVAGRIPTVSEVHEYLANDSESRRIAAINRLMHSGIYYRTMATFWRRTWVPQADTREFSGVTDGFESWLSGRLRDGAHYDDVVTEILTQDPSNRSVGPRGYYEANQSKPENLAASSSRGFLGLNLDCAQCHDHPHSRWTREQFWQTAAFFAEVPRQASLRSSLPRIKIPDTDLECEPVLLTAAEIRIASASDSVALRQTFVGWMLQDGERLMAKNAVNRLWSHFFGEAIIEPMDDLSRAEFQSGERAVLLHELSDLFIATGYDLDVLVKGMVSSQAYCLASMPGASDDGDTAETASQADESLFRLTRAPVRGLTGEQFYDSLQVAAGLPMERTDVGGSSGPRHRSEFVAEFYVERPLGAERSISQALTLMNGSFVNGLTTSTGNRVLASLLTSPFMGPDDQVDTVFVAVLGRHATTDEIETVRRHFAANPAMSPEHQLGGLFWALVNSAEFSTNH
jgi:hypothetical protein